MSLLSGERHNREPQRRAVPLEGFQVNLLVVRAAVLPATVEDPDPLVGQRTNGGVVVRATPDRNSRIFALLHDVNRICISGRALNWPNSAQMRTSNRAGS